MKTKLIALFSTLFLLGCEKPSGKWQALKDTPVFNEAEDLEETKYTVKMGEICALGREQVAKIYMYRQVKCAQGKGWIMYEGSYAFQKLE
jgi:hypothetical protein